MAMRLIRYSTQYQRSSAFTSHGNPPHPTSPYHTSLALARALFRRADTRSFRIRTSTPRTTHPYHPLTPALAPAPAPAHIHAPDADTIPNRPSRRCCRSRVRWPSLTHKIAFPVLVALFGMLSGTCNHNPGHSTFCFYYYPNANTAILFAFTLFKHYSMKHRSAIPPLTATAAATTTDKARPVAQWAKAAKAFRCKFRSGASEGTATGERSSGTAFLLFPVAVVVVVAFHLCSSGSFSW